MSSLFVFQQDKTILASPFLCTIPTLAKGKHDSKRGTNHLNFFFEHQLAPTPSMLYLDGQTFDLLELKYSKVF